MIKITIERTSMGYFAERKLYNKMLSLETESYWKKFSFPSFKEFRKLIWVL